MIEGLIGMIEGYLLRLSSFSRLLCEPSGEEGGGIEEVG